MMDPEGRSRTDETDDFALHPILLGLHSILLGHCTLTPSS